MASMLEPIEFIKLQALSRKAYRTYVGRVQVRLALPDLLEKVKMQAIFASMYKKNDHMLEFVERFFSLKFSKRDPHN